MTNKQQKKTASVVAIALIAVMALYYFTQVQAQPQMIYPSISIQYIDGTWNNQTYTGKGPFAIVDPTQGKEVSQVVVSFHMAATFTGQVTGYTVEGTSEGLLYDSATNQQIMRLWGPTTLNPGGGVITSGQDVTVTESAVPVSTLQSWYSGWTVGKEYYYVVWSPNPVKVILTFSDGHQANMSVMPTRLAWIFRYEPDFISLSIWYGGYGN